MVLGFPGVLQQAQLRPRARPQPQEPHPVPALRPVHRRGPAQMLAKEGRQHLKQQPLVERMPKPLRVRRQKQHRVKLKQVELIPPRHRATADASAKRAPHQAKGREAQPIPDQTPTTSVSRKGPNNAKAKLAHTSRVPTMSDLAPSNPAQGKRRQEHIITSTQVNAKQVVRPSDPKETNRRVVASNREPCNRAS